MLPDAKKMGSMLEESKQDKQRQNVVWDLCELYMHGQQGEASGQAVDARDAMRRRARQALYNPNMLLDYYRVAASRLVAIPPSATVLPTSPSTDDVKDAIASQELVKFFWWDADVAEAWDGSIPPLLTFGNVGYRTFWEADLDELTGGDEGKVKLEEFSPRDLFYEPGVRHERETLWITQRKHVSRHALKEQFPAHHEAIDDAADENPNKGLLGGLFRGNRKLKDRLTVHYVYAKDGSHDHGIFLAPNVWLWEGKVPEGTVGIHHIRYTKLTGTVWGMGLIESLLSPQAAYAKGRKQQMDHIDLVNKPKIMVSKGAKLKRGAFNDRAGQIIVHEDGFRPQYAIGPSWPAGAERQLDRIRNEMNDIAGMQNTSLGKTTNATSGVAIRSLASQDISKLQITQTGVENTFAKIFRDALILYKTHLTSSRTGRIFDVYGSAIWTSIDSTRLVEDPEVRIDAGSMFAMRAADREQRTLALMQAGLVTPEDAKQMINIQVGRRAAMDLMQDLNEAHEILEVAKEGTIGFDPTSGEPLVTSIQIFKTDPLGAYRKVFGEFMRDSASFYALPPDRQDVITDIFMAVSNPDANVNGQSLEASIVYPPQAKSQEELAGLMGAVQSPETAVGMMQNRQEVQRRRGVAQGLKTASKPLNQLGTQHLPVAPRDIEGGQ